MKKETAPKPEAPKKPKVRRSRKRCLRCGEPVSSTVVGYGADGFCDYCGHMAEKSAEE